MKAALISALCLLASACGSDPSSGSTRCASNGLIGTWRMSTGPTTYSASTITFKEDCTGVSNDCNTVFTYSDSFKIAGKATFSGTEAFQVTSSSGSGCYAPGTIIGVSYNGGVETSGTRVGMTHLQLQFDGGAYSSYYK